VLRVLHLARSLGLHDAVVVVGPHHDAIASVLRGDPGRIVLNSAWELGRTGSIQAGLRQTAPGSSVLLWPIDHPFVAANTVQDLLDATARDPLAVWVVPTYEGRGGHPVWLGPTATGLVASLAPDEPLRNLIPRLGVQVLRMPTTDPWIRVGTDTPAEYAAAVTRRHAGE
jgi:molybdenum cofactor cytidylyltransferase